MFLPGKEPTVMPQAAACCCYAILQSLLHIQQQAVVTVACHSSSGKQVKQFQAAQLLTPLLNLLVTPLQQLLLTLLQQAQG